MKKHCLLIIGLLIMVLIILVLVGCARVDNTKSTLSPDMIKTNFDITSFVYTGDAIEPSPENFNFRGVANSARWEDFDYIYENNINVGEATMTVIAKDSCEYATGKATFTFNIVPTQFVANDFALLKTSLLNKNYKPIVVSQTLDVPINESVVIDKDQILRIYGELNNFGSINVEGVLQVGILDYNSVLNNYGAISSTGTIIVSENSKIYTKNGVENKIINNGEIYTDGVQLDNVEGSGKMIVRSSIANAQIVIPQFPQYVDGKTEYTIDNLQLILNNISIKPSALKIEYFNNTCVGEATIKISAKPKDANFYGEVSKQFEILRGTTTVSDLETLKTAFKNNNYNKTVFMPTSNVYVSENLVIPNDWTVDFSNIDSLSISGSIIANGKIILAKGTSILSTASLTYSSTVEVKTGSELIIDGKIEQHNLGKIVNFGTIFYNSEVAVSASSFDNSKGHIYSYCDVPCLENLTVKKLLDSDEVDLHLESPIVYYTSFAQRPKLLINDKFGTFSAQGLSIYYKRGNDYTTDFTKAGEITILVSSFRNSKNAFRGTKTLSYKIEQTQCNVTTFVNLTTALADEGYHTVSLSNDICFTKNISVPAFKKLDLNGYQLSGEYYITNYGTIINTKKPAEGVSPNDLDCGLIFDGLINGDTGVIQNHGLMRSEPKSSSFLSNKGSIINQGQIFINRQAELGTMSGDGKIILRQSLADGVATIGDVLDYTVDYDGFPQQPKASLSLYGNEVLSSDFDISYLSNTNAGNAYVCFSPSEKNYSPYYSTLLKTFTINRGVKIISSGDSLPECLSNSNWREVKLEANYYYDNYKESQPLSLADNLLFNMQGYMVYYNSADLTPSLIKMSANSTIIAEADTLERFNTLLYIADKITLKADILNSQISIKSGSDTTRLYANGEKSAEVCLNIDLNGFKLNSQLTLGAVSGNTLNLTIDNSKTTGGIYVPVGLTQPVAILIYASSGLVNLTVNNTYVEGLYLYNGNVNFNAVNSTITASSEADNALNIYGGNKQTTLNLNNTKIDGLTKTGLRITGINVNGTFTDCEITGSNALLSNGGNVSFQNCAISSTGNYLAPQTQNLGNGYAVGIIFASHSVNYTFENCIMTSAQGFCIVQRTTGSGVILPTKYSITLINPNVSGFKGPYSFTNQDCLLIRQVDI